MQSNAKKKKNQTMNLSKLQEMVKDRGIWHAIVHGVTKSRTRLRDWKTTDKREKSPKFCPEKCYSLIFLCRLQREREHHEKLSRNRPFQCIQIYRKQKAEYFQAYSKGTVEPWVQNPKMRTWERNSLKSTDTKNHKQGYNNLNLAVHKNVNIYSKFGFIPELQGGLIL